MATTNPWMVCALMSRITPPIEGAATVAFIDDDASLAQVALAPARRRRTTGPGFRHRAGIPLIAPNASEFRASFRTCAGPVWMGFN
jgi:hypothetical protein